MKLMVLAFLSVALFSRAACADTLGGLPAEGTVLSAYPVASGYRVVIPVGADGRYSDISVASSEAALSGIITAHVAQRAVSGNSVRVLNIDIGKPVPPQGQYTATLTATPTPDSGTKQEPNIKQERNIQIRIAPTTIETPPSLVIARTIWWPGQVSISANGLELWPSQAFRDRGWLSSLVLQQKNNLDVPAVSGRVVFPGTATVAPGEVKRFEYRDHPVAGNFGLEGKFLLGVSHATVVVMADQLAAPLSVPVEIQSKLAWIYLIGMLFVGLVLGWLVRQRLKTFQDINNKRKTALALMDVIDAAIQAKQDTVYVAAANAAKQVVQAALLDTDPAKIQTAIDAAQDALTKAAVDYDSRAVALKAQIASVDSLLSQHWRAPKQVVDEIAVDQAKMTAIKALADLSDAGAQLKNLTTALANAALAGANALCQRIGDLSDKVAGLQAFASEPAATAFVQALGGSGDAIRAAARKLEADPAMPLDLLTALLQVLHVAAIDIGNALQGLSRAIGLAVTDWSARATGKTLEKSQEWQDALVAIQTFQKNLQDIAEDAQDMPDLASGLGALRTQVENAIRNQAAGDATVTKAITDGAYAQAIGALPAAMTGFVAQSAKPPAGAPPTEVAGNALAAFVSFLARKKEPPPSPIVHSGVRVTPSLTPQMLKALVERNLAVASYLQTAIYGGIILTSGFFIFRAAWVGTPQDFVAAFAWAFVIDIGADSATTALQGLSRK